DPVHGLYCRQCALIRKILEDVFQDFQDTSESSDDNTNFVNQDPFVVKQDPGKNSSQSPPLINHHCCYKCGDSLDDIFCQRCTCKSCGKCAYIGYNCPSEDLIVSNPEPCNNQTIDELPQTLPSFDLTCYYGDGNSFTYDSTPNFVNDSPNVFTPPSQPPTYSYKICGNHAYYGYDCSLQVPFIYNSEPGPHETFQCQPMKEDYYYKQYSCYDPNSFGFDQIQPPQYIVSHPIFNAENELFNSQNKVLNSQSKLIEQMTSLCDMVGQIMQKKEEEKQIAEEQPAKDRYWKIPICYDDDEEYTIAITPNLSVTIRQFQIVIYFSSINYNFHFYVEI
ncbi:hypothetical protein Tco_0942175, partial [Tanacetum coccineum]